MAHTAAGSSASDRAKHIDPEAAEQTYFVREWGDGYFRVNSDGHVAVRPLADRDLEIDIFSVASQLRERGTHFPLLLRFQDLLQLRVQELNDAFDRAIRATGYRNSYCGVYPIKVNQLREVVEEILDAGAPYRFGLECGSKAELVATLAYAPEDTLLICNGCKDAVMMRLMLEGQEMHRDIIPVLERFDEFEQFVSILPEVDVVGQFGVRARLSTSGAGLWSESGGENSKFGLSLSEIMRVVVQLEQDERAPEFRLLHFHLGSQIADLANVRQAVREAARIYAGLRKRGVPITYLDVGGGLGVSYEAGNPDVAGHIDYDLQSYAHAIIDEVGRICDDEGVDHPVIVSESGRAVTAFHSVLLVEVLGVRDKGVPERAESPLRTEAATSLKRLVERARASAERVADLESIYRDAEVLRAQAVEAFRSGALGIEDKAQVDQHFWAVCTAVREVYDEIADNEPPADSLHRLFGLLPDHYLCNFSVFRSVVDHWAIGQRFPVMPIHRLDEEPTRRGVLVDLTCDSDGTVSDFVAPTGQKQYLELHDPVVGQPYLLGFFLMGAYQDIMGDMHNLFGRVTEAHVYADEEEPGNFYVEKVLDGATVEEQLALVQYFPNDLERRMNDLVMTKVRNAHLKPKEAVLILEQYRQAFREYTYLNIDPASGKKRPVRGSVIGRPAERT